MDFRQYYDLEAYLLDSVRPRFAQQGFLSAFDFFCIVIWKANRAKSKISKKLLERGYKDLDAAVHTLTTGLAQQTTTKDRLRYLWEQWGFRLPLASAVLSILYPDEFTVYDVRVCDILRRFHNLANLVNFDHVWRDYQAFQQAVEESAPPEFSLRDKDRFLWGKSFHKQLLLDIENAFNVQQADLEYAEGAHPAR